jgi:hypothetical protein
MLERRHSTFTGRELVTTCDIYLKISETIVT